MGLRLFKIGVAGLNPASAGGRHKCLSHLTCLILPVGLCEILLLREPIPRNLLKTLGEYDILSTVFAFSSSLARAFLMGTKPLVPFFEGRTRSFYKYPMSVYPYLILTEGFEQYELDGRKDWAEYFERQHTRWVEAILLDFDSQFHEMVDEFFADLSDDDLLRSVLSEHGIFNYAYFKRDVLPRVAQQFSRARIGINKIRDLAGELPKREGLQMPRAWYIKTERDAFFEIFEHLYEQTLLRVITEPDSYKELESWFQEFSQYQNCALCGDTFRVVDLPMNYYFGSSACKDCCFGCPITLAPGRQELMSLVPTFVQACGFIPNSNADPINHGFTARLSPERKLDVFRAYAGMGGVEHVKSQFGSWFQALAETGALPDGVLHTPRGIRCLADDGHACHSLDEQYIDNWLSAHGIPHEREPYYVRHPRLNQHGTRRADWRVGDTIIEYFGLIGDEEYEKKMAEKMLLASYTGVHLIALYPSDLEHLDTKLLVLRKGSQL